MPNTCCSNIHHDHLRDTDAWFGLPLVGIQHTPEDDVGPGEDKELRNCECGSTLARIVSMYLPTVVVP